MSREASCLLGQVRLWAKHWFSASSPHAPFCIFAILEIYRFRHATVYSVKGKRNGVAFCLWFVFSESTRYPFHYITWYELLTYMCQVLYERMWTNQPATSASSRSYSACRRRSYCGSVTYQALSPPSFGANTQRACTTGDRQWLDQTSRFDHYYACQLTNSFHHGCLISFTILLTL